MTECPKCQSFMSDNHCKKCEEDFIFKFGLEASRNKKQEQTKIEWKIKPDSKNCGKRKD